MSKVFCTTRVLGGQHALKAGDVCRTQACRPAVRFDHCRRTGVESQTKPLREAKFGAEGRQGVDHELHVLVKVDAQV
ncbi:MAG TPA: hypothetical protein VHV77_16540, partial [Pirellulales bacterium]|nr:hypothetical protein [Pirellulales bacterium]